MYFFIVRNRMQTATTNITYELRMVWNNNQNFLDVLHAIQHATSEVAVTKNEVVVVDLLISIKTCNNLLLS